MRTRMSSRGVLGPFLDSIGVAEVLPKTSPFDPGYDPYTLEGHLQQSAHLMSTLKISMACWMIADESVTRHKIAMAKAHGVESVTGGGPFEIALAQGKLREFFEMCAELGVARVECGEGFTELDQNPSEICALAKDYGLGVQFEVGKKHGGAFDDATVSALIDQGNAWLEAGACQIIIEGRENAADVGLYAADGKINYGHPERFIDAFGFDVASFETPTKETQFALLRHFGTEVEICNVRIEELLRVEIFRRGLHSDAFQIEKLRPRRPEDAGEAN